MKAVDYLKAKARMTNNCDTCDECPLDIENNEMNLTCVKLEGNDPEQAVEIVEKWEKDNPVKTYLSILLEKFPHGKRKPFGAPVVCPHDLFNIEQICPGTSCKDCWNREYKEEEE